MTFMLWPQLNRHEKGSLDRLDLLKVLEQIQCEPASGIVGSLYDLLRPVVAVSELVFGRLVGL